MTNELFKEELLSLGVEALIATKSLELRHKNYLWLFAAINSLDTTNAIRLEVNSENKTLILQFKNKELDQNWLLHAIKTALQPQSLLFDMDGVLADVSKSFRIAIIETAKSFGAKVSGEEIKALKAKGNANNDWILTKRLLEKRSIKTDLATVIKRFEEIYQGTAKTPGLRLTEKLIPSKTFLEKITSKYPSAIVTGRPKKDSNLFLLNAGIKELFAASVCMEDGPAKPNPYPVLKALELLNKQRAWMFGDTPDDIHAAREASVIPIGIIAPGEDHNSTKTLLKESGAALVLDTVEQIDEFLL